MAEQLDAPINTLLGISGHSIKHLVSAVAALFAVFAVLEMQPPERR